MISEEKQRQLDRLLDGDLSEEERVNLQKDLENDQEAIDWLADRAWMHANLTSPCNGEDWKPGQKKLLRRRLCPFSESIRE